MAGELVAEAFLSVLFEKLFEKLTSLDFVNFFRGKESIDDQLKQLKTKLEKVSGLLNDAENRQLDEPKVKKWLDELKDVIYRAQDLMEDIEDEARSKKERESESSTSLPKKMKFTIISSFSESNKTIKGEIAKILEDLDLLLANEVGIDLKDEENAYKNSTTTGSSSKPIPLAPWPQECDVRGRSADKEEIMKLLLSNDIWGGKIGVLPIVGMGGLGKTTLAQLIYADGVW
ncbi:P-loop containing nucleoside triphosphate hydrolase, partial [Trema orientale]